MILPPIVVDVRVSEPESRSYHIWLPVVLLWPLLIILVGFALAISIIVDFVLLIAGARYHHFTLLIFAVLGLLAETRGTDVHVKGSDATLVDVVIY
jgi:hypothetical protein